MRSIQFSYLTAGDIFFVTRYDGQRFTCIVVKEPTADDFGYAREIDRDIIVPVGGSVRVNIMETVGGERVALKYNDVPVGTRFYYSCNLYRRTFLETVAGYDDELSTVNSDHVSYDFGDVLASKGADVADWIATAVADAIADAERLIAARAAAIADAGLPADIVSAAAPNAYGDRHDIAARAAADRLRDAGFIIEIGRLSTVTDGVRVDLGRITA